jgi:type IV pilus assembly protein PilF
MRGALLVPLLLALAACTPAGGGGNGNLRPQETSNDVAIANLNLAIEYMRRGDYQKALEKLDKARAADPGYPQTYNTYGVLYEVLGQTARAEQNFRKALQISPGDSATLNNYGRFLCKSGRTREAESAFLEAASNPLYETPEIPLTNAGLCALGEGRSAEAEQHFRKALQINPKLAAALLPMARLSYDGGNYLSARGYLQRYDEVAKPTAESLWLGIRIERELGDRNAVASYSLLLRNEFPDSNEAKLLRENGTAP